eukprot:4541795-Heterocapsa_arctica.AAC.1
MKTRGSLKYLPLPTAHEEFAVLSRLPAASAAVPCGPKTALVVLRQTALSFILPLGRTLPFLREVAKLVRKALKQPKRGARKRVESCGKSVPGQPRKRRP